jgi:hypothetical protein
MTKKGNPGEDITEKVLADLPSPLATLEQHISERFGRPVLFRLVKPTGNQAEGWYDVQGGQPVVCLVEGHENDNHVRAEELLHLKRRADGHPEIQGLLFSPYRKICKLLTGLLDEYAFYPVLKGWGYPAGSEVERLLPEGLNAIQKYLPERERAPANWVLAKRALAYARVALLVEPSEARTGFLDAYGKRGLIISKACGEALVAALRANADAGPNGTKLQLVACIGILQLPSDQYTICHSPGRAHDHSET